MEHNSAIRTYMAIMAERDAAIRERNVALDERRRAFAERDMAMLQRDAAIAERNSAMEERDKALSELQFLESSMNENDISPYSLGNEIIHGTDHLYHQQQMDSKSELAETAYDTSEVLMNKPQLQTTAGSSDIAKTRKVKKTKEIKGTSAKNSKLSRKGKRPEGFSEADVTASEHWKNDAELGGDGDDLNLQLNDNVVNQANLDESTRQAPFYKLV
ncbi:hypothetical protein NMG60_11026294 [Bertholletia excelsa]